MRINHKILSLPPYISTSWKNVISLHAEHRMGVVILSIGLVSGERIEVPNLELPIIDAIFQAHAKSMDLETSKTAQESVREHSESAPTLMEQISLSFPMKMSSGSLENTLESFGENFGPLLQHNPEQAEAPSLPVDILNKIATLSKTAGISDTDLIPEAEPHCNCIHCQIARAVRGNVEGIAHPHEEIEEEVSDEDLKFRTWNIEQTAPTLYNVTNPLDEKESYSVFLGDPVGCTCGHSSCEHVIAVLKS